MHLDLTKLREAAGNDSGFYTDSHPKNLLVLVLAWNLLVFALARALLLGSCLVRW